MNQMDESTLVEVDGKSPRLTHLSKVMFPEEGFTKAELLLYYQGVAPLLLPHLRGRPLTLKTFSHGVKELLRSPFNAIRTVSQTATKAASRAAGLHRPRVASRTRISGSGEVASTAPSILCSES